MLSVNRRADLTMGSGSHIFLFLITQTVLAEHRAVFCLSQKISTLNALKQWLEKRHLNMVLIGFLGAERIIYIIHSAVSKVDMYEFRIATGIFTQNLFFYRALNCTTRFKKCLPGRFCLNGSRDDGCPRTRTRGQNSAVPLSSICCFFAQFIFI